MAGKSSAIKFQSSVSSLKFLRKTPWARAKVESLYVFVQNKKLHKKLKQQQRHQNKVSTKPVDERKKE